jgi:hypothetical protein
MELTPFWESEVLGLSPDASQSLWVRGGFPDSFLAETEVQSFEWRAAFIQTYLERDVPSLGPRIPAETLHRFLADARAQSGPDVERGAISGRVGDQRPDSRQVSRHHGRSPACAPSATVGLKCRQASCSLPKGLCTR